MAVSDTTGGVELARSLRESTPPESGTPVSELLDLFFDRVVPPTFNTTHPGYLAFVPGGGIPHSAVADLIAGVTNRYVTVFAAAPAVAQIEANVIQWFCHIVGYPETARGLLTTGGSLANWTALVTARRERLGDDFLQGTIYASDQTHHCVAKSAILTGFPEANVRSVPTDERYRIRLTELEQMIEEDRSRGLTPFCVVGNAGTTNTGAVDPLDALADLAAQHRLWFHVDAAYGGFFMLTAEGRRVLRGLERADSLVLDPHKGMFLPYGTGALLVKDGAALKRAHTLVADYMPHIQDDPELIDFCEHSAELSRSFRGLRVWLPVKMHGIGVFRGQLEEKLALARHAADELRRIPNIEILAEPELSLLAFRLVPPGVSDSEELNRLNRDFQNRINARQRVFLTGTMLGPLYALRICILSFRTHKEHVEQALEDVRGAAAAFVRLPNR
jgi:aromatic-L-amino-acid decarboxylase